MENEAIFDKHKKYRYLLTRYFETGNKTITFIMLNPSTADETLDDPTIRRCISFAKKLDVKKMQVVNLFAYRTPNVSVLKNAQEPIGEENNFYIENSAKESDIIILAWGNNGVYQNRAFIVKEMLKEFKNKIYALKILKNGEPSHPLYLKKDIVPALYFESID